MKKIIRCIFLIGMAFSISATAEEVVKRKREIPDGHCFYKPTTEAEKKLDYILHLRDSDELWSMVGGYIRKWPHTRPKEPLQYTDLFTKEFIYAWSEEEKDYVNKTCKGKYEQEQKCGLGFIALSCFQESDTQYLYRTIENKEDYAIIQYTWAKNHASFLESDMCIWDVEWAVYRMVKRNNVWVLDGVRCENDGSNIKFIQRYYS